MGCEDGGCGHYRDGTETFYPEREVVSSCDLGSRSPISEVEVFSLSGEDFFSGHELEGDIPVFSSIDEFQQSDFFQKYYYLGDVGLEGKWMWDICNQEQEKIMTETGQVLLLRPLIEPENQDAAKNLQRILIALGYLRQENLDPGRSYSGEARESEIIYLGALGQAEHLAIRQFQANNGFVSNGIIADQEKQELYSQIFEKFHKAS